MRNASTVYRPSRWSAEWEGPSTNTTADGRPSSPRSRGRAQRRQRGQARGHPPRNRLAAARGLRQLDPRPRRCSKIPGPARACGREDVLHDDATANTPTGPREGLPDTKIGRFPPELDDEATRTAEFVISMKNDWSVSSRSSSAWSVVVESRHCGEVLLGRSFGWYSSDAVALVASAAISFRGSDCRSAASFKSAAASRYTLPLRFSECEDNHIQASACALLKRLIEPEETRHAQDRFCRAVHLDRWPHIHTPLPCWPSSSHRASPDHARRCLQLEEDRPRHLRPSRVAPREPWDTPSWERARGTAKTAVAVGRHDWERGECFGVSFVERRLLCRSRRRRWP